MSAIVASMRARIAANVARVAERKSAADKAAAERDSRLAALGVVRYPAPVKAVRHG